MASSTSITQIERGEAAFTAIKRNMPALISGVTQGNIPPTLYSKELISEETMELLLCVGIIDSKKGTAITRDVQKVVRSCPDLLDVFCQILSSEIVTEDLAKTIHGKYENKFIVYNYC